MCIYVCTYIYIYRERESAFCFLSASLAARLELLVEGSPPHIIDIVSSSIVIVIIMIIISSSSSSSSMVIIINSIIVIVIVSASTPTIPACGLKQSCVSTSETKYKKS